MIITGNKEKKAEYYDSIYKKGYNTQNYYPLYQEVLRIIASLTKPRVLELGCGLGDLGMLIINKGFRYRGIDFSEEAINQCLKNFPQGNFSIGNVYDEELFLPDDYNVVVALEVFEHVEDIEVIKNIKPGATVIGSVPDYPDDAHLRLYKDRQNDIIEYYKPYLHIRDIRSAQTDNKKTGEIQTIHIFTAIRLIE